MVEDLHDLFPDAPVYVAYLRPEGLGHHWDRLKKWDIRTSWMQKMPFANKFISPFRVFAPSAFENFDLSEYDVVISSSAIYFAKAVITKPGAVHIAYIHTPPRYLYGYVTSYNYKKHLITRIGGELANHFLRLWDFETSQRPDILVTNSKEVQKRIQKFYRRDSIVIHPGVDIEAFEKVEKTNGGYFLFLGRLVRGKGVDVIVEACTRLNLPLKVAGSGPILGELKKEQGRVLNFWDRSRKMKKLNFIQVPQPSSLPQKMRILGSPKLRPWQLAHLLLPSGQVVIWRQLWREKQVSFLTQPVKLQILKLLLMNKPSKI